MKEIILIIKNELIIIGLLFAVYTDVKYGKIYNKFNLLFFLTGLFFKILELNIYSLINALLGSFIGFLIFLIFFQLGGVGGGDVKLIGALGVWVGVPSIIWILFFTSITGALFAFIFYIFRRKKEIPYSIAILTGFFLWNIFKLFS